MKNRVDYATNANGQDIAGDAERLQLQPGSAELRRIVDALRAGQTPAPADVNAVRALQPSSWIGPALPDERRIAELIADLHSGDPEKRRTAWGLIDLLLPTDLPEPVADWREIAAPEREWLIKDWMPAGRIGMLSGTGGAGKSLLALQVSAAIASGEREWLGRPGAGDPLLTLAAEDARHVVYAGYEDEPEEIRRRLGWIEARSEGDLLGAIGTRLTYVPMAARGPVWAVPTGITRHGRAQNTGAGEWLRDYCAQRRACLLIIDPLAAAYGSDENDNAAAAEFIANWAAWATSADCAVLLIHHLAKAEAASGEGEGYRGATAWQGGMRYLWRLRSETLEALKTSYAPSPKPAILRRNRDTRYTWQLAADQTPRADKGREGKCQGTNARGEPCSSMATANGYCKHHQGQASAKANMKGEASDNRIPGT